MEEEFENKEEEEEKFEEDYEEKIENQELINDYKEKLRTRTIKEKEKEKEIENKNQKEFFQEFPLDKIGGVIRILFELDSNLNTKKETRIFKQNFNGYEIDQIIITITNNNLNSFLFEDENNYFMNLFQNCKRKREEEEYDLQKNKKKVKNCCNCTKGQCIDCYCVINNQLCTNCNSKNCKNTNNDADIDDYIDDNN